MINLFARYDGVSEMRMVIPVSKFPVDEVHTCSTTSGDLRTLNSTTPEDLRTQ